MIAVDYDAAAVAHVRNRYPGCRSGGQSGVVPLGDAAVDVVVNFQVIEHLWDQPQFITECLRVLRPGGLLLISTPNRITFTPGSDTPVNPFHTRELNAAELAELLTGAGFRIDGLYGVFHGPRLLEMDIRHGGSIIDAQIARALADAPWPAELAADVAAVRTEDFDLLRADGATSTTAWTWWRSRCTRDSRAVHPGAAHPPPMVGHHGRWPVGEGGSTSPGRRPTCR